MILNASDEDDPRLSALLSSYGISVAAPRGCKFGRVNKLVVDAAAGQITYGFIHPVDFESDNEIASRPVLFFSHMRRAENTQELEFPIVSPSEGDIVSFEMGMNYKGPCAIDVALVKKVFGGAAHRPLQITAQTKRAEAPTADDIVAALRDAVAVCADEDGWALMSRVRQRLPSIPNYKGLMQAASARKISQIVESHPAIFEQSGADGSDTRYSAACIRIRA